MCYGSVQHIAVLELYSFMKKLQELLEDDSGFSLKHGTTAVRRGVKPVNKVGAINYKEPVTHKRTVVCSYDRIQGTFYHN